jgi:hypothetical protein
VGVGERIEHFYQHPLNGGPVRLPNQFLDATAVYALHCKPWRPYQARVTHGLCNIEGPMVVDGDHIWVI